MKVNTLETGNAAADRGQTSAQNEMKDIVMMNGGCSGCHGDRRNTTTCLGYGDCYCRCRYSAGDSENGSKLASHSCGREQYDHSGSGGSCHTPPLDRG